MVDCVSQESGESLRDDRSLRKEDREGKVEQSGGAGKDSKEMRDIKEELVGIGRRKIRDVLEGANGGFGANNSKKGRNLEPAVEEEEVKVEEEST